MGYYTDLVTVTDPAKGGTKEYYDARIRLFQMEMRKAAVSIGAHLDTFMPLSDKQEEKELIAIRASLLKIVNKK